METKVTVSKENTDFINTALQVVQYGLKSMYDLQAQTALTHQKFLETQKESMRTLQIMIEKIQTLFENMLGTKTEVEAISFSQTKSLDPITVQKDSEKPVGKINNLNQKNNDSAYDIEKIIFEIVASLTGYPVEMLNKDMDIEIDLGIDSIKRLEIFSKIEEKLPALINISPEIIGTMRTLGEIEGYFSSIISVNRDTSRNINKDIIKEG